MGQSSSSRTAGEIGKDFGCDFNKDDRMMNVFPFVKAMLYEPALRVLLSDNIPVDGDSEILKGLNDYDRGNFVDEDNPSENPRDEMPGVVEWLRLKARQAGYDMRELVRPSPRRQSLRTKKLRLWANWRTYRREGFMEYMEFMGKGIEAEGALDLKDRDAVVNSVVDIKIEDLLPDKADSSYFLTNKEKCRALFLMTAIPALCKIKEPVEILYFLLDLSAEMDNLPERICDACEGQPLAILLIGTVLSLKPRDYNTWAKVIDDIDKIKESGYGDSDNNPLRRKAEKHLADLIQRRKLADSRDSDNNPMQGRANKLLEDLNQGKLSHSSDSDDDSSDSDNGVTNDLPRHIFTYCIYDLPLSLQSCFLYLSCYPIDYEIPARSLTEIWMAEEFFAPEGETMEETANKYMELLVERLLVSVSKRSLLGTIKCCRVRRSIHELVIKESWRDEFLAANPDYRKNLYSFTRLALHHDNNRDCTDFCDSKMDIVSFLAFDSDKNFLPRSDSLRVLESRKSAIPINQFNYFGYGGELRYMGLRGSKIYELPNDMGHMKNLQTLDVRDTRIKTLPKFLWDISTLRHVYVNPSPKIEGPPSEAYIPNLQILKAVGVPESWLEIENFPQFLINLRKLALSNTDYPDSKSNPYWKPISKLLSRMVNLISMAITGDIVPAEFVDCRAFPNLETVKSIRLEGEWNYKKLPIDNVKFPSNLTRLTLTKSGLKEDPMPSLERIEALKYLSLKDGAYIGKKMVCSANGFPQLQFLEIFKLKNLEIWEVKQMVMSQVTTLCVVQCHKLTNLPDLEHVTNKVIGH